MRGDLRGMLGKGMGGCAQKVGLLPEGVGAGVAKRAPVDGHGDAGAEPRQCLGSCQRGEVPRPDVVAVAPYGEECHIEVKSLAHAVHFLKKVCVAGKID